LGERGGEPGAEGCEQQEYNNTLVEFGFHKVSRIWFVPDGRRFGSFEPILRLIQLNYNLNIALAAGKMFQPIKRSKMATE
jgi:hypothetical protein